VRADEARPLCFQGYRVSNRIQQPGSTPISALVVLVLAASCVTFAAEAQEAAVTPLDLTYEYLIFEKMSS
jgi:hypothetical protein